MKYLLPLLPFLMLCLTGCEPSAVEQNRELAAEVMAIHDEAMARMTEMHELKLQLQERQPTPQIIQAIFDLEAAHSGMMKWMRAYKKPATEAELEKARDYLLEEKIRIEKVAQDIDSSIAQASELLD